MSIAYEEGVKRFLDFSFANAISRDTIKCPCKNCSNVYYRSRDEVYEHLICDGFEKSYARGVWIFHGEKFALDEERLGLLGPYNTDGCTPYFICKVIT